LAGVTATSITDSGLTSGRVTYAGTAGLLQDSANLTFNGTTLTANTIGAFTLGGTVAGGGNQLNNVVIGTSTPLAGSFTTLTTSSTVTINGGTANGVAYLNGSKVLTTGTTLTFDGQTLTNTRDTPILVLNDTAASNVALRFLSTGGFNYIQSGISGGAFAPLVFSTNGGSSEMMRLDSSGNLLVGTTTAQLDSASKQVVLNASGTVAEFTNSSGTATQAVLRSWQNATTGDNLFQTFHTDAAATQRGSISYNRAGGLTVYNTTSDYRLKEHIIDLPNALETVSRLKPRQFDWKETGNTTTGFIAHELAEVCPHAVTGEKDAVEMQKYEISPAVPATQDEEGNELTAAVEAVMGEREVPRYQGIDTSFLVATLTAALQEAHGLIKDLTTRITALENK